MEIIISNTSDKPIYEQIAEQVEGAIVSGRLASGDALPSIRALAADLRISVITTRRAYAELEARGLIDTVQGKGSFVSGATDALLREKRLRHIEALIEQAVDEARLLGVGRDELRVMVDMLCESS
ncbi:MAG: GntR family transcriptional regulator [Slackia sp.]|nr:GntR family transcriptional regulator [Slackia sp.]